MYGMGVQSIADTINGSKEEAQEILDGFFQSFPKVRKWIDETEAFGKKYGYVEDWFGRRRRLPNLLLDPYVVTRIKNKDSSTSDFNPFLGCSNRVFKDTLIEKYKKDCESIRSYRDYDNIKKKAFKEGIDIQANTSLISAATRQCVNARIQGGAATMTKVAMIKLFNDKELNDLDFHMLIGVHDELIGECPKENAEKVADRLTYIMKTCIEDYCVVPFKCDAEISEHWYQESYDSTINKEFKTLLKECVNIDDAINVLCNNHTETSREKLENYIKAQFNLNQC